MEEKIEYKLYEKDGKIIVERENITLKHNGENVGVRKQIDSYDPEKIELIKAELMQDLEKFNKQMYKLDAEIETAMQHFNKREIDKIKIFIEKQNKAQAYTKYINAKNQKDNILDMVDKINEELTDLSNIEKV